MAPDFLKLAGNWAQPTFTLNSVEFTITKMGAEEAFEVLELLRPGINSALVKIDAGVANKMAATDEGRFSVMLGMFAMALPPATLKEAKSRLFQKVHFRDRNRSVPVPLDGRIDEAFSDPVHIYQVIGRAFAVNFSASFSDIMSVIDNLRDTPPPNTPT